MESEEPFNSSLGPNDPNQAKGSCVALIPQNEVIAPKRFKTRYWFLAIGLFVVLLGLIVGGAFLLKDLVHQGELVYFHRIKFIERNHTKQKEETALPPQVQEIEETIRVLPDDNVEIIDVPLPSFTKDDKASVIHDFSKNLTAYKVPDLRRCYIIPLNTSVIPPPKDFADMLKKLKDGAYEVATYVIREQMMVTGRVYNLQELGKHIREQCDGMEVYRLQQRDSVLGKQKREAMECRKILHFQNKVVTETTICDPWLSSDSFRVLSSSACSQEHLILLLLFNVVLFWASFDPLNTQ
ncbi:hypothetical protein GJAV_G00254870 [Gymnothorax javanicus]|nr:hypothetical protein GJAV_G00254870 [Gymnothorax javanicus]